MLLVKNIDSGKEKLASRVLGLSPYRPDNVTSAAVAISSLRDAFNQTVSSDSEDVNLRSQPALGENAFERGQNKFIRMAYDRFVRSIEKDIFLPEYVVKAALFRRPEYC